LDRVRRLTNFSTGSLGGELANHLANQGHEVRLLLGETATWQSPLAAVAVDRFSTTESLRQRFVEATDWRPNLVFHAAAVGDFTGGASFRRLPNGTLAPVAAGKLTTRDGNLLIELRPTPKLLPKLCTTFTGARIIGWKHEVDGTTKDALAAGRRQLAESLSFGCVVNGPAYGVGFGFLRSGEEVLHLADKPALFDALAALGR
jgi:phosphopantothenoylcysteine synthetase/decarboxylase